MPTKCYTFGMKSGTSKREPSKPRRVKVKNVTKVERIRRLWKCTFADALDRLAGKNIDREYKKLFPQG